MAILVQASIGGGSYASGLVTVVSGNVVQLRLDPNTSGGVSSVYWEILEYPTGAALPAGWTSSGADSWYFSATALTGLMPPAITMPAQWGKYLVRATANNGVWGGAVDYTEARDETCALNMLSDGGIENIAALETTQSDERGVLGVVKRAIETLDPFTPEGEAPVHALAAGVAWHTLATFAIAAILPVDGKVRGIDIELAVTDDGGEIDIIRAYGSIRRAGAGAQLCNLDDGTTSAAAVTWLPIPLVTAGEGQIIRLSVSGANIIIEAQEDAGGARSVVGGYRLGVVR